MSERLDGEWQAPVNLGPLVNSEASDHHSLPSVDGNSLYITSNREGGYGLEDIYVTTRSEAGEWGPMVNLGPLVNTGTNDRCPAFSDGGDTASRLHPLLLGLGAGGGVRSEGSLVDRDGEPARQLVAGPGVGRRALDARLPGPGS